MAEKEISSQKVSLYAVGMIIIILLAALPSFYFYQQYQNTQKLLNNPTEAAKEETRKIIESVSKLIALPPGEPTLATVTDKSKLKTEPFFKNSQNGDKVLFYVQAQKAILYRPSMNKIIEVSPLNLSTQSAKTVPTQYSIAIYNGTSTPGLATNVEKQLSEQVKNINVTVKDNASKSDYTKTLVVDVKGDKSAVAQQLAQLLSAQVSKLPEGEKVPNTDFLIIVGK